MFYQQFPQLTLVDKNIDSTEYIFKRMFLVRTPREAILNRNEIEQWGSRSTGFRRYDEQLVGAYTQVYLPIAKIADIMHEGYHISLCDAANDSKRMYEYIQYHLESWMQVINGSMHKVDAPIEDLRKLDALANNVYAIAAGYYKSDDMSEFEKFLTDLNFGGALPSMDLLYNQDQEQKPAVNTEAPARKSFQDELLQYQADLLGQ